MLAVQTIAGPGRGIRRQTAPDVFSGQQPARRKSAGVGNVVDGKKNFFPEKDGDYGAKFARGGIAEKVLLSFPAGTDFERCTAEEVLRFWAARLLGGHCFKVDWIHRRRGGGGVPNRLRWRGKRTGQKIGNDVFKARQIKHGDVEF